MANDIFTMTPLLLNAEILHDLQSIHQLPDLQIYLFEHKFQLETLRTQLRMQAFSELKNQNIITKEHPSLLDLKSIPTLSKGDISFSHSQKTCGFVFSQQVHQLGFDIEEQQRVSDPPVKRVSSEQEFQQAPSPLHLWVAKEAAFKALHKALPKVHVLSHVEIHSWSSHSHNLSLAHATAFNCTLTCSITNLNNRAFSICVFPLNFRPGTPIDI